MSHLTQRITIVGGGVAGLVAAHGLHRAGFKHLHLIERAASLRASSSALRGGGVVLAANGCRVLDRLGLLAAARQRGRVIGQVTVRNAVDHPINAYSPLDLSRTGGLQSDHFGDLAIHGAALHDSLIDALPDAVEVTCNAEVEAIKKKSEKEEATVQLMLKDGPKDGIESDLVIGADGIRSHVRSLVPTLGREPSELKGIYARGLTRADAVGNMQPTDQLIEYWGTGRKIAYYWIDDKTIAWLATLSKSLDDGNLAAKFSGFPSPIPALLSHATDVETYPILECAPQPVLHSGRVVLLGEAAHASTQELWQNMAQDAEDAAMLSVCLAGLPWKEALTRFEQARYPRTSFVANASREETKQAIATSKFMASIRDMASSMIPPSVMRESMAQLLKYDAIEEALSVAPNSNSQL